MKSNFTQYQRYINNKRVVVVGPADTLVGKDKGPFIDSYDVVIRTNGSFPVDIKYHADYGKRCDVLYTNQLYERKTRMNPKQFAQLGLTFLVLKTDLHSTQYRFKSSKVRTRLALPEFMRTQRSLKVPLLMGTFIIHDILMCNPKELFLTGMTLYQNGPEYIDNYLPSGVNVNDLEETRKRSHKQEIQNKIWKEKYETGQIKVDEDLEKILMSIK